MAGPPASTRALDINSLNMALFLLFVPLAALLSDRLGRKPLLITGVTSLLLLAYPLFALMHHGDSGMVFLGQFGFVVVTSLIFGTYPTTMVEMVSPRVRVTALSIGYNLCLAIFGGTTPLISSYLIARTSNDLAPAFYLMATAVVSLSVLFTIKETAGRNIHAVSGETER